MDIGHENKNILGKPKSRIILALDTPDRDSSFRVLDQCHDLVDVIKFNYPLILKEGLDLMTKIKLKYGLPIIADFKIADVPVTNNRIVNLVSDAGADAILAHGFIGSDAIQDMMDITEGKLGIILVTELTHPGGLEYTRKYSEEFARLAKFLGCYGIQAPGTRPEQIRVLRDIVGPELTVVSCGVGAQGGKFHDAIKSGADYAIIGRSIYLSEAPRDFILGLNNEVSNIQK